VLFSALWSIMTINELHKLCSISKTKVTFKTTKKPTYFKKEIAVFAPEYVLYCSISILPQVVLVLDYVKLLSQKNSMNHFDNSDGIWALRDQQNHSRLNGFYLFTLRSLR